MLSSKMCINLVEKILREYITEIYDFSKEFLYIFKSNMFCQGKLYVICKYDTNYIIFINTEDFPRYSSFRIVKNKIRFSLIHYSLLHRDLLQILDDEIVSINTYKFNGNDPLRI